MNGSSTQGSATVAIRLFTANTRCSNVDPDRGNEKIKSGFTVTRSPRGLFHDTQDLCKNPAQFIHRPSDITRSCPELQVCFNDSMIDNQTVRKGIGFFPAQHYIESRSETAMTARAVHADIDSK